MKKNNLLFFLLLLFSFFSCKKNTTNLRLEKGMVITESVTVMPDIYRMNANEGSDESAILIKGENIVVDFQGATLQGSSGEKTFVRSFGTAIKVEGTNIEIKNLKVKGFLNGLIAKNVDSLKISNSSFNYNFSSYLGFHQWPNESLIGIATPPQIEIATSVKLDSCNNFIFKNNQVKQNENGLIISNSKNGEISNNEISNNSHAGISFQHCHHNKIMHNYLDWNTSGISISKNSSENIVAYNSVTHSKKNLLEKNILFENDFFPFSTDSISQNNIITKVAPLPDGQKVNSLKYKFRGDQYILRNKWGIYNFEYPAIWLREINDDKYTFAIFGPEGNWKIVNGNGFSQTSRQSGSMPATIVASKSKNEKSDLSLSLQLEFIGVEFTDQFGNVNPRGKTLKFGF
jgi:parallel beta-helix repeat protein